MGVNITKYIDRILKLLPMIIIWVLHVHIVEVSVVPEKMELPKLPNELVPADYYLWDTNVSSSTLKALLFLKFSIQVINNDYIISLMTIYVSTIN